MLICLNLRAQFFQYKTYIKFWIIPDDILENVITDKITQTLTKKLLRKKREGQKQAKNCSREGAKM